MACWRAASSSGTTAMRPRVAMFGCLGAFALLGFGSMPVHADARDVTPSDPSAVVLRMDRRVLLRDDVAVTEDALLARADALQYQHRFVEAEQLVSRWLGAPPQDADRGAVAQALLMRAQLRIEQGQARRALADCVRAATGLNAVVATACEAQALAMLSGASGARAALDAVLRRGDLRVSSAELSWAQGIAATLAARAGDPVAAERWFRAAVDNGGNVHYPRVAYAQFLLAQRRPDEALELLAQASDDATVMRLRRQAFESRARQ